MKKTQGGLVLVERLRPTQSARAVALVFARRIPALETRTLHKRGKPLARAGLKTYDDEKEQQA